MGRLKITLVLAAATAALALTPACGSKGSSYSLMASGNHFVQTNSAFNGKLDILFVINDEPAMSSYQAKLVASFATFMNMFQTKGYDFKISVVTPSGYLADPTLNGYTSTNDNAADFNDYNGSQHSGQFVLTPSDTNLLSDFAINAKPTKNSAGQDGRSFSSFRQALQSARPIDAGFLRSDSFLAVVIVDSQDDFSGNQRCEGCNVSGRYSAATLDPVSTYVNFLSTLTGTSGATARYNVSAMTQINTPCQGSSLMTRVMDLANQTNGILGDICQSDFGADMTKIADQIAVLSTQFFLHGNPIVSSITVAINGVSIAQDAVNGWTYDSTANSIQFHGRATPQQGASIDVNFDPQSLTF